ncbi:unnamed protein product [Macrosiphum euphorbiae]|uniref:Uncharacterized protein n=1 Tax=Macrosiphum euphorbiae TaxID=13131 RepID=A0AAV0XE24_9HEMI|nr:unnamed protein product [Macrosiphum euphorbiae]
MPEIDGTQRRQVYQRLAASLRTGTSKVFRVVREHLSPMTSQRRAVVKTTVTTTTTTKVVETRARSMTTVETTTTTASTTKVATADCIRTNPCLTTIAYVKSVVPSDGFKKGFEDHADDDHNHYNYHDQHRPDRQNHNHRQEN